MRKNVLSLLLVLLVSMTAEAGTSTVKFALWGGDPKINSWVDEAVGDQMSKLGYKLRRQPLADTASAVNKLLAEKRAGKQRGSMDVLWINGENFKLAKENGLLYGPLGPKVAQFKAHYDAQSSQVQQDFGTPIDGMQLPWGQAYFVFIYDQNKVKQPPRSYPELLQWVKRHPGRFTYPAPPDFTGSSFIKQVLFATSGGSQQFQDKLNLPLLTQKQSYLLNYLNELRPYLWLEGKHYPESIAKLNQLYADGEVWITMAMSPLFAEGEIRAGRFPPGSRTWVMEEGTLHNSHYLAVPWNSPNKEGALALVNLLLSPAMQLAKLDPSNWGDFPALDPSTLTQQQQKELKAVDLGASTLPLEQLRSRLWSEIQPEYLLQLEAAWSENIATRSHH